MNQATETAGTETSQEKLLLLLLGGRIQPAGMTLLQLRPALLGCIASKDTPGTVALIRALVAQHLPQTRPLEPHWVDPYEPAQTRRALNEFLAGAPQAQPVISLTGAPMPMAVAGYEVARRLACPAYYLNTEAGQLLNLAEEVVSHVDVRLTVEEYLNLYGAEMVARPALSDEQLEPVLKATLEALAADPPATAELLAWLSPALTLAPPARRTRAWTLGEGHWRLLCRLAELGLVRELERRPNARGETVTIGLVSPQAAHLLAGRWLEQYLYLQASLAQLDGTPLFDSCAAGVRTRWSGALRELDFLGIRRGKALAASCKTGRQPWDKAALDELVAVAKGLGDNYCTKLFITNQLRPAATSDQARAYSHFLGQAERARVVIVTGDLLPALQAVLVQEATRPRFPGI